MDPMHGAPQPWAQNCFYVCAYAIFAQLVLVLTVPLLFGGDVKRGETDGDVVFDVTNDTMFWLLTAIRYVLMVAVYGGFIMVICSVYLLKAEYGETPPISPAMMCVINLTVQFFFIYLLLWVTITLNQIKQTREVLQKFLKMAVPTLEAAKNTVQYCPMLCVLFMGLRMRALQITDNKGEPQGWAQQGMYLATYAVLIQNITVLVLPVMTGAEPACDDDGNVMLPATRNALWWTLSILRYLCLLFLYGGAMIVVCALFMITPETATGRGSLIPFVSLPQPQIVPLED